MPESTTAGSQRARTYPVVALVPFLVALFVILPGGADAYVKTSDISYDLGSPPSDPARNQLDIYLPEAPSSLPRPFVFHIHGGGWRTGDKANASMPDKASLFTGLGYGLVSINYRLSPMTGDPDNPDPNRVKFPDHPDDVGEAIGWLSRNALGYGLDPDRMILMGHSAGAHLASLVSVDPTYIERYGVDRRQILGVIPLDTAAFDIETSVLGSDPDEPSLLFANAFGTPAENALTGSWEQASPLTWADASDPRHLFVVQNVAYRINRQVLMANKLGQDSASVVSVPLNHNGINRAVGSPTDTTQTTPSIIAFVADRLARYEVPQVRITKRPPATLRLRRGPARVVFAFKGSGTTSGFQCRLDGGQFRSCDSPRRYRVGRGTHAFRVRPLYPSGRPGETKLVKWRFVTKKQR
jgi:acetyl esterase/lipase